MRFVQHLNSLVKASLKVTIAGRRRVAGQQFNTRDNDVSHNNNSFLSSSEQPRNSSESEFFGKNQETFNAGKS
jgi:hypothetical protein